MSAPTIENPTLAPEPQNPTEKKSKKGLIYAGIGAVAVASAAVGFALGGGGGEKASSNPESTSITLENSTPDQFWSDIFTDAERVQYAEKLLRQPSVDPNYPNMTVEKAAYLRLQTKLGSLGRSPLMELVPPSIDNTPNEALVQEQTVTAAAIYAPDSDTGEKILAASDDDSNPLLERGRQDVRAKHMLSDAERLDNDFKIVFASNDAAATAAAGHDVPQATGISRGAPIGNIAVEPEVPTRVTTVFDNQDSNEVSENVQVFVGGRWITKDVFDQSDVGKWIPPRNLVNINVE